MPRDTATRRFQLTFNNPKEHDYSHEKIKSLLEAGGKIGYWCMGDEIGTQETYHTHLYVEFVNPTMIATVYKGNIIKNLIMDCQSYTKYRPNETTGGIFVSWRRKEELPTGA